MFDIKTILQDVRKAKIEIADLRAQLKKTYYAAFDMTADKLQAFKAVYDRWQKEYSTAYLAASECPEVIMYGEDILDVNQMLRRFKSRTPADIWQRMVTA